MYIFYSYNKRVGSEKVKTGIVIKIFSKEWKARKDMFNIGAKEFKEINESFRDVQDIALSQNTDDSVIDIGNEIKTMKTILKLSGILC